MRKSLLILVLGFLSFLIIHSCIKCDTKDYNIVSLKKTSALNQDYQSIDTADSTFIIDMQLNLVLAHQLNLSLMNSCYATKCPPDLVLNAPDSSQINLYCDKDLIHNGKNITAGDNIMDLNGLRYSTYFDRIDIEFTKNFIDQTTFGKEDYVFHIETRLKNGVDLKGQVHLFMDL